MKDRKCLHLAIAVLTVGLVTACAPAPTKPTASPLELQAIQSHQFQAPKKVAFAAVLSVFQDLGYIVASASLDTGFITASSPTKSRHDWLLTGNQYQHATRATAFVEEIRKGVANVRLNFVVANKTSSAWGQSSENDTVVEDAKVYESAFNKIGDAIFIRASSQ